MAGARNLKNRPLCAECNKPVESFTEEDGEGVLRGYVLFVARCHGQVERQKVPRQWTSGLNFGMAFIPPSRLPEGTYSNRLDPANGPTALGLEQAMWRLRRHLVRRR